MWFRGMINMQNDYFLQRNKLKLEMIKNALKLMFSVFFNGIRNNTVQDMEEY